MTDRERNLEAADREESMTTETKTPTTVKEVAAEIRKRVKAAGWNARKVSVKVNHLGVDSAVRVTIRSADVPLPRVRDLANGFAHVDRCSATGEILLGGNLYVDVRYADTATAPKRTDVLAAITDREPGVVVEFEGVRIWRCTAERDYFWIDADPDAITKKVWGAEYAAKTVAELVLGGEVRR
jgi:hypothetical protein